MDKGTRWQVADRTRTANRSALVHLELVRGRGEIECARSGELLTPRRFYSYLLTGSRLSPSGYI